MSVLRFLLLLAAFLCFIVAAFAVRARSLTRINLVALGLAFWVFIFLIAELTGLSP